MTKPDKKEEEKFLSEDKSKTHKITKQEAIKFMIEEFGVATV